MSDSESEVIVQPQKARNDKQKLIAEVLCRWWMCMPAWPPVDYDYSSKLKEKNLRKVHIDEWEDAEDVIDGVEKVYQLTEYPGVFRRVDGSAIDLRPSEGKPSYENMDKMSADELWRLLVLALTVQLRVLKDKSPFSEEILIERLERQLEYAKRKKLF